MEIKVVSKTDCPFCKMAKTWLEEHGFQFEEQLMDNEEERLAFYQSLNNGVGEIVGKSDQVRRVNSVPQIFIDGKRSDQGEVWYDHSGRADALRKGHAFSH